MKEKNIKKIFDTIKQESVRQNADIELIASENFVSKEVIAAQGSCLTNKYAEGYPGKRYYGGCTHVDEIENIAISLCKEMFNAGYANVQPHSGSQANQAVFLALLKPGDTILSMNLNSGGHLTHGSRVNMSGKWFNIEHYSVDPDTYLIDYDEVEKIALETRPKLIIAGYSAYTRPLDFAKFRKIADSVGAYLLADVAHIAGLIVAGRHQNPIDFADAVTSTTHKTLRGPRGGIILSSNPDLYKKLNSAVFPGAQGGPLMHVIAAKAVAFSEALDPSFKKYIGQVIKNSQALSDSLLNEGIDVITGGTDNHMVLVSLIKNNLEGLATEKKLEEYNITCNKNTIPYDPRPPSVASGLRLGSPACTTRGMVESDFNMIGKLIADLLNNTEKYDIAEEVRALCDKYPIVI